SGACTFIGIVPARRRGDYSFGTSSGFGGLSLFGFLLLLLPPSIRFGGGGTVTSTHEKPNGSFSSRRARTAPEVPGWSSTTLCKRAWASLPAAAALSLKWTSASGTSRQALEPGFWNLGMSFFILAQAQLYS